MSDKKSKIEEIAALMHKADNSQVIEPKDVSPAPVKKKLEWLKPCQFKEGQSGNPGGRPKRKVFSDSLRAVIDTTDPETQRTMAVELWNAAFEMAMTGDCELLKILLDRSEGKVESGEGEGSGPQQVIIIGDKVQVNNLKSQPTQLEQGEVLIELPDPKEK